MNSYIDETSKEEFNEDITIREALDSIKSRPRPQHFLM